MILTGGCGRRFCFVCSGRNTSYTAGQSVMLEQKKRSRDVLATPWGEGRIYTRFAMAGAKQNFQQSLNCLLCGERGQALAMPFGRCDNFHFLPVVGKFSAAIETSYVGPGKSGCLRTTGCATYGDGKAVTRVPTTEKRIEQFRDHGAPSTTRAGYPANLIYCTEQ